MTRWYTRAGVVDVLHEIPAGEGGQQCGYAELEPPLSRCAALMQPCSSRGLDDIIASKEHADRDKDRRSSVT